jgi:hypothetical protein
MNRAAPIRHAIDMLSSKHLPHRDELGSDKAASVTVE